MKADIERDGPVTEPMPELVATRASGEIIHPDFRERFGRRAYEIHVRHRPKARPWSHLHVRAREEWARVAAGVLAEAARDP